jgi:membrane protease YdiL (CAAX protease family)
MSVQPNINDPIAAPRAARRGLVLYGLLVVVFDAVFVGVIVGTGDAQWIFALMWSVAVASVICRLVLREGFRDVSFRFGGVRTLGFVAAAVAFPVVIGLVAYGVGWATGLADYVAPPGGFVAGLLLAATVSTVVSCVSAAGEEIGWRGYMLTRLIEGGIRYPVLVSGVVWGLWHVPLIVTGLYVAGGQQSMVVTLAVFMVGATAFAFVLARFRLQTGSIWPAIVLHGAWNSVIQSAFDPAAAGLRAQLWLGESGILVALTLVVAAVLMSLGRWPMLRAPGQPLLVTPGG